MFIGFVIALAARTVRAALPHAADRDTARAIAEGDAAAFDRLVHRHRRGVHNAVKAIVGDDATAEELCQEAWTAVYKNIASYRGDASLKNWIYRIAVNQARRAAKNRHRMPVVEDDGGAALDRFTPTGAWAHPVTPWRSIDPHTHLLNREALQVLSRLLDELPPLQRAVVTMVDVEDIDRSDVCALLDITPENLRISLHRGRRFLRARLEQHERSDHAHV